MSAVRSQDAFFRCPVTGKCAVGSLKVGRKRIPVTVIATSIDGFTLCVGKRYAKRIRENCSWTLVLLNERSRVTPQWMFNDADGDTKLSVRRLQDLTPQEGVRRSWFVWNHRSQDSGASTSGIALGGMLLLITAIVCLPGIGDDLGSAPWIRSFLREALRHLGMSVRQFLNS
ncbi:hypothetical protein EC9_13360 [Rosistilla ulvae]|uniref:Uncharacterized protein n=1 Tax=Rosistilla ulvae TaxID=1930277 RepID=A0A517LX20_9BACT|nr:hypothetical protein [Rosistilla ulvae]QDS87159.1 hypothetical protein EC9_13360 [Rosistilla ulvae]